jgi:hypothetical protein
MIGSEIQKDSIIGLGILNPIGRKARIAELEDGDFRKANGLEGKAGLAFLKTCQPCFSKNYLLIKLEHFTQFLV